MNQKINIKNLGILTFSAILFTWAIFNMQTVANICDYIISLLFPFILGLFIAIILNIPMRNIEKFLNRKSKKKKKLKRIFAIALSIVIILLVIALLLLFVIPEIYNIAREIANHVPYYKEQFNNFINWIQQKFPDISVETLEVSIDKSLDSAKNGIFSNIPNLISSTIQIAKSTMGAITTLLLSIILAIYILMQKEKLKKQLNSLCITYLKENVANRVIYIFRLFINKFSNFFSPVYFEAILFGIMCFIGMSILQIPYAVEVSALVGFTALIPVIGSFIGMIIGVILIVTTSPIKALIFAILIFILQQIDGNLLYPRFVGEAVDLPGIWVLISVMIGGKVMGLIGTLIAVPIGAIIYALVKERIYSYKNKQDEKVFENE